MTEHASLLGLQFGHWTIIGTDTKRRFLCMCSCGSTKSVFIENLKRGYSKSCGCVARAKPAHNYIDLTGMVFGKLTVLERAANPGSKIAKFRCLCECGKETVVRAGHLKNGHTKSCGCLSIDAVSNRFTTHGKSKTPTYRSWEAMIRRCTNQKCDAYPWYGGRQITVCDEWERFDSFLKDMGERPVGMELDRVDNYKGYAPDNCRWVTHKENCMNRRNNVAE